MTKIDIISGFLGAGKTTLIQKLLKEAMAGEQVVLIENEFGEIGIDGGFLKEAGIEIREMNSGCICCSLVGDFGESLKEVLTTYHPDRILIEPSGVGKLSDVMHAVEGVNEQAEVTLNSSVVVVDAQKCRMYMKNFGEFFNNQIEHSHTIVLSRTDRMKEEKIQQTVALIREHNPSADIITTPWPLLDGKQILEAMEKTQSNLMEELKKEVMEAHKNSSAHEELCECGHHHHHHDEEACECGHHHHHHDEEACECGHHHHHHDEEACECGHHHHHDEEHHHHHHDHHHHHADEVFTSWGLETAKKYGKEELSAMMEELSDAERYGNVLRSKGMVAAKEGNDWYYFDFVPGEAEIRIGKPQITGKICVIGSQIKEENLSALFGKGLE